MHTTAEHADDIVRLYSEGQSTVKLADRYLVSTTSILGLLKRRGVIMRSRGVKGQRPAKQMFDDEQRAKITRLLRDGMAMSDVAKLMGVTPTTIQRYARWLNVHTPRKNLTQHTPAIVAAFKAGVHVDKLAEQYQTTRPTIYSLAARGGLNVQAVGVELRAPFKQTIRERQLRHNAHGAHRWRTDPAWRARRAQRDIDRRARYAAVTLPIMQAFWADGCRDCREGRPAALDAHHRDPATKMMNVGSRTQATAPTDLLTAELAKCDCLCAFCHRVRHYEEDQLKPRKPAASPTSMVMREAKIRFTPIFQAFRRGGCQICARSHPSGIGLSAHHLDPTTKLFNVSRAIPERMRTEPVIAELKKCVCVCENCHRLIHADELECPVPRHVEYPVV